MIPPSPPKSLSDLRFRHDLLAVTVHQPSKLQWRSLRQLHARHAFRLLRRGSEFCYIHIRSARLHPACLPNNRHGTRRSAHGGLPCISHLGNHSGRDRSRSWRTTALAGGRPLVQRRPPVKPATSSGLSSDMRRLGDLAGHRGRSICRRGI